MALLSAKRELELWALLACDLSRSHVLTCAQPGCRGIIATEDIPAELCAEEPLILLPERLVLSTEVAQKELATVLAFHELTRFKVGASQQLNGGSCLLQARAREVCEPSSWSPNAVWVHAAPLNCRTGLTLCCRWPCCWLASAAGARNHSEHPICSCCQISQATAGTWRGQHWQQQSSRRSKCWVSRSKMGCGLDGFALPRL